MTLHLDHFIPLRDAAKLFGLSESRLHELVRLGKIRGAILPGGEIGVSQDAAVTALNEKLRAVKREQFKYLAGQGITVTDGAKKYGVHRTTILNWIRHGYITALKTGYRQVVDEADLAYCFAIYDLRKRHDALFGAPLLDEDRLPYIIKHPFLSEQRRKERL